MKRAVLASLLLATSLCSRGASAQYGLRADAYAAAATPSAGLLMLTGEARQPSWFDAETVVWLGTGQQPADVLVTQVRARAPRGLGEVRVGRMIVSAGAIRPLHLDGIDAIGRAPSGTSLEVFGGLPVATADGPRDYDWAVGQRLAQRLGEYGVVGMSYLELRSAGEIAYEELGVDAAATPVRWLDAAFAGAYDLERTGLTDARVSLATRLGGLRLETFAVRRSPSHLLPATSLFAALGDVPSDRAGASLLWRAAPRLDVTGEGAAESLAGELGAQFRLRTTLRLDERGNASLGLEARRQSVPDASWTGLRGMARLPLSRLFTASTELEIVRPDDPRGRGSVWPWGLVSLGLRPTPVWEFAGAVEASASPTNVAQASAIVRVSRLFGAR